MDSYEKVFAKCLEVVWELFPYFDKDSETDQAEVGFWSTYINQNYDDWEAEGLTSRQMVARFKRKIKAFLSRK